MDLITQGLLGACMAQTASRKKDVRPATISGFFAGMLADADTLIHSSSDPLLSLEFHRHFSHSLIFILPGALLAALLLWPVMKKYLPAGRLYLYCLLGYSLSGLLDACTSYGTHLLWPFSDERISLSIIAIIDPVFSLILLAGIILTIRNRSTISTITALGLCTVYLLFAWMQQQRAVETTRILAAQHGHKIEKLIVKPTLANLLLWRSVYQADGLFHINAIRTGIFTPVRIYHGGSIAIASAPEEGSNVQDNDIIRFAAFSDHYMVKTGSAPLAYGDIRYANEPTSLVPLWGIEVKPGKPDQHAQFRFYRKMDSRTRQRFIDMLLNRDIQ